jgi:hypothetical protein
MPTQPAVMDLQFSRDLGNLAEVLLRAEFAAARAKKLRASYEKQYPMSSAEQDQVRSSLPPNAA